MKTSPTMLHKALCSIDEALEYLSRSMDPDLDESIGHLIDARDELEKTYTEKESE